jgi:hypothetical protein
MEIPLVVVVVVVEVVWIAEVQPLVVMSTDAFVVLFVVKTTSPSTCCMVFLSCKGAEVGVCNLGMDGNNGVMSGSSAFWVVGLLWWFFGIRIR